MEVAVAYSPILCFEPPYFSYTKFILPHNLNTFPGVFFVVVFYRTNFFCVKNNKLTDHRRSPKGKKSYLSDLRNNCTHQDKDSRLLFFIILWHEVHSKMTAWSFNVSFLNTPIKKGLYLWSQSIDPPSVDKIDSEHPTVWLMACPSRSTLAGNPTPPHL